MELFSKWSSAREYIRDNKAHTVKGSFYFLGRKDDKGDAFEEDFFAPHGGNVVSIAETVSSVEVANLPFTLFFPDQKQEATTELTAHFKPQFEEYAAGEIYSGAECEHCDFQDLCTYVPAPLFSQEEKAKKSIRDIVLSKAQEDAVFFRKGIGRINAVAGCGKTLIVALRTAYMLSEGVKPEEILLITFTNAGAAEMKERIEMYDDDLMTESDLSKLTCTTFNSFGDSIIKKEYARFGFTEEPRLIDDIERKEIITELLDVREIKELKSDEYDYMYIMEEGAKLYDDALRAFFGHRSRDLRKRCTVEARIRLAEGERPSDADYASATNLLKNFQKFGITSLVKSGEVKPGDIIGAQTYAHTMVYKGKAKKGKKPYLFFSVGRKATNSHVPSRITNNHRPGSWKVGVIIRPKNAGSFSSSDAEAEGSTASGATRSDFDILAAYSVSVGNSEMELVDEESSKENIMSMPFCLTFERSLHTAKLFLHAAATASFRSDLHSCKVILMPLVHSRYLDAEQSAQSSVQA